MATLFISTLVLLLGYIFYRKKGKLIDKELYINKNDYLLSLTKKVECLKINYLPHP